MVRDYGAYANRARKLYRSEDGEVGVQVVDPEPAPAGRASWARLLRQVFEVDVLACPQYHGGMKAVSLLAALLLLGCTAEPPAERFEIR
jgi:hypothetical protein